MIHLCFVLCFTLHISAGLIKSDLRRQKANALVKAAVSVLQFCFNRGNFGMSLPEKHRCNTTDVGCIPFSYFSPGMLLQLSQTFELNNGDIVKKLVRRCFSYYGTSKVVTKALSSVCLYVKHVVKVTCASCAAAEITSSVLHVVFGLAAVFSQHAGSLTSFKSTAVIFSACLVVFIFLLSLHV